MSASVIELNRVTKWYESDPDRRIISALDLEIQPGERFAIVGPSGCGKSTLLNLLGTLDSPSKGEMKVSGQSTEKLSAKELAGLRAQEIGFIFQLHHLLPQCSALENVLVPTLALPQKVNKEAKKGRSSYLDERAKELFERVGLQDKLNSLPSQLSGGERQRVAVIRALINQPKILLADEPTGALDEENAANLVDLLIELNEAENLALVMVSHDVELAQRLGDVRTLKAGQLTSHPSA